MFDEMRHKVKYKSFMLKQTWKPDTNSWDFRRIVLHLYFIDRLTPKRTHTHIEKSIMKKDLFFQQNQEDYKDDEEDTIDKRKKCKPVW